MTTPGRFDATTDVPSTYLPFPILATDTEIRVPGEVQTWIAAAGLPYHLRIGEETIKAVSGGTASLPITSLTAPLTIGDETMSVASTQFVSADQATGIRHGAAIAGAPGPVVLGIIDATTVLIEPSPVSGNTGFSVGWSDIGSANAQSLSSVTVVRGRRGTAATPHARGTSVAQISELGDYLTVYDVRTYNHVRFQLDIYTFEYAAYDVMAFWQWAMPRAGWDTTNGSVTWTGVVPLEAARYFNLTRTTGAADFPNVNLTGSVSLTRVVDNTGVIVPRTSRAAFTSNVNFTDHSSAGQTALFTGTPTATVDVQAHPAGSDLEILTAGQYLVTVDLGLFPQS